MSSSQPARRSSQLALKPFLSTLKRLLSPMRRPPNQLALMPSELAQNSQPAPRPSQLAMSPSQPAPRSTQLALKPHMIRLAATNVWKRCQACIQAKGDHFEAYHKQLLQFCILPICIDIKRQLCMIFLSYFDLDWCI